MGKSIQSPVERSLIDHQNTIAKCVTVQSVNQPILKKGKNIICQRPDTIFYIL